MKRMDRMNRKGKMCKIENSKDFILNRKNRRNRYKGNRRRTNNRMKRIVRKERMNRIEKSND
jgi:hypothetical protein